MDDSVDGGDVRRHTVLLQPNTAFSSSRRTLRALRELVMTFFRYLVLICNFLERRQGFSAVLDTLGKKFLFFIVQCNLGGCGSWINGQNFHDHSPLGSFAVLTVSRSLSLIYLRFYCYIYDFIETSMSSINEIFLDRMLQYFRSRYLWPLTKKTLQQE